MKVWRLGVFVMMIVLLLVMTAGMAFAQEEEPEIEDSEAEGESDSQNPVAVFLGEVTLLGYDAIIGYQTDGYGLGNIGKAFYYAGEGGDLEAIMLQAQGEGGWGQIKNEYSEANPDLDKRGGHGLGWLFRAHPDIDKPGNSNRPEWAGPKIKGDGWTGGPPPHAGPKPKDNEDGDTD